MLLPFQADIWLYPTPVDFRKHVDELVVLASAHLDKDPTSEQLQRHAAYISAWHLWQKRMASTHITITSMCYQG